MKRVFAQAQKEMRQFWRDRLTVALAFVLPVITLFLFGFALRLEEKDIPIAIQDFDASPLSRGLTERLLNNWQMNGVSYPTSNIVKSAVDSGAAQAAIIIPPEFDRKFRAGHQSPIEVLIDGTDVNNARVIKNSIIAVNTFYQNSLDIDRKKDPIRINTRIWFNPGRKESLYVVPGALGLILWIYPSLLAALAMVREKEQGTILQAYASSITDRELIAGKALAYLIISLMIALLVTFISIVLYGLWFEGDPTPFLIGTVVYCLDAVLFGMVIATGVNTQNAAVQGVATAGFTTSLLLSGFLYPLRNIKPPFNYLSYIVPARYYMQLARDAFVRGSGWMGVGLVPLILLLFALVYFNVCKKRMNNMQIKA
jgi:ABC-2 type transport system permease protein